MRIHFRFLIWLCALFSLVCAEGNLFAQTSDSFTLKSALRSRQTRAREYEWASLFAPVFYQALGDKPRNDYITNFDFDGDWRGDNNWNNVENSQFPLKAYVYYSVLETSSHIFLHYAVFHPRDYKGGERRGAILSTLIQEGAKRGGKYDPTGLAEESVLAHENDMEGCLLVVAKSGTEPKSARVVYVETLHHNVFSRYVTGKPIPQGFEPIEMDGQQVLLYVEPKGHGILAYHESEEQSAKKRFLIYTFTGKAEAPVQDAEGFIGYELIPIESTLWSRSRINSEDQLSDSTYGAAHDYGKVTINFLQPGGHVTTRKVAVGKRGSAFLGNVGGRNMARPPWAWADRNRREDPLGIWFFDPAMIIKRDFALDGTFSTTYVRVPWWAAGQ